MIDIPFSIETQRQCGDYSDWFLYVWLYRHTDTPDLLLPVHIPPNWLPSTSDIQIDNLQLHNQLFHHHKIEHLLLPIFRLTTAKSPRSSSMTSRSNHNRSNACELPWSRLTPFEMSISRMTLSGKITTIMTMSRTPSFRTSTWQNKTFRVTLF